MVEWKSEEKRILAMGGISRASTRQADGFSVQKYSVFQTTYHPLFYALQTPSFCRPKSLTKKSIKFAVN
jgi:hypothetical protein